MLRAVLLSLLLSLSLPALSLEPLSDAAMAEVAGKQGVIFNVSLANNVDEQNDPLGCSGTLNGCRLGLEFAGRDAIWLMMKEFYGTLDVSGLRVDVGFLPDTPTPFRDADRFRGTDGSCLITGCDPSGNPALLLTYPANTGAPVGQYDDLHSFFNIGRVALEFDDTVNGIPGYDRDQATGSFLGFRISDSTGPNAEAGARFLGTGYLYGF